MKSIIVEKIRNSVERIGLRLPDNFVVSQPPKSEMGDWSTNVAMIVAGQDKSNPRELAEKIVADLAKDSDLEKVEIAGPGFINIFVKPELYFAEIAKIVEQKADYGRDIAKEKKEVNVEYISANPTGPLHVGNARGGPLGEAMAQLYSFLGHKVTREFYINDIGSQVEKFGRSLFYYFEIKSSPAIDFPENGYPGEYVKEISEKIQSEFEAEIEQVSDRDDKINFFKEKGLEIIISEIEEDCKLLDIKFDIWTRQSEIENTGKAKQIIDELKSKNATAEKDGALWLKIPADPDLEDRETVLSKSDEGETLTYFAADIAYHADKIERGADLLIDVWGANHSGHVPRMKAALRALGYSEDLLNILLYQYVRLKRSGQVVSMGKRLGNFVTLREIIEGGVDKDVFKYFILSQNANTPMDFDLDLASDTSEKNPVYYIKYAHARICSILGRDGVAERQSDRVNLNLLTHPKEVALYKELVKFPDTISEIAENFQIQSLPHFVYKIAGLFHDFYGSCKVIGAETPELETARLSVILATKYVISNSLEILGIEAPDRM